MHSELAELATTGGADSGAGATTGGCTAELARREAEAARLQADAQVEMARRQAEAEAALKAQELKDEAELRQLELEMLEQEERGSLPASDAAPAARCPPVTAPPAHPREPVQTDMSVARTREWLAQSQLHVRPAAAVPLIAPPAPAPAPVLLRPSGTVTQATPHLPRITLDKFSGSALEWPRWIALFKALVHDRADLTDVERLTYLQSHLTGPARESVRGMLCDASLYGAALHELEEEFGDPSRVIHANMRKLLTARPVRDGELSALTELSRDLHTAVSVLQCLHYESDLAAATNVTAVTGKLPASLAWKWGEHVVQNGIARPTLVDLDAWLRGHVAAGRVAVIQTLKQPPKVESNSADNSRPRRVFATSSAAEARRPAGKPAPMTAIKSSAAASEECAMCRQTHKIHGCDKFLALTATERAEFAGRSGLCFNCLRGGHISARCPCEERCGDESCGKRHHTLLHNGQRVFPRRNAAGGAPQSTKHVGTAEAESRGQILLQVVPITVHGPAGSHKTHALLDLGSQVTLVTDDLCDRLGISGPSDGLILSTLNGSERLQSRRVCFTVQPVVTGGDKHEVRNAQTTPRLNVKNHHTMDWSQEKDKWPHLTDLQLPSSTHGPVDVLLGTDVIELIVPREVVQGPPGTPCAVRTLLG